jgi:hypothetical protein
MKGLLEINKVRLQIVTEAGGNMGIGVAGQFISKDIHNIETPAFCFSPVIRSFQSLLDAMRKKYEVPYMPLPLVFSPAGFRCCTNHYKE